MSSENNTIDIANDFTDAPGGRHRVDGPKSAEEFRDDILIPKLDLLSHKDVLTINLDGCYGYATSFLEEVFGGLARTRGLNVLDKIVLISDEEPSLVQEIENYVKTCRG